MKISKSIYKVLFIIAWAMTTTACSDEQYEINKVEEGLPASVTLSLSVPSALETTMTRATDVQETNVEKVAFLFYKKNQEGTLPVVVEAENLGKPEKVTETNYKYTGITIQDSRLTSGKWYLYAVANYGRNGITLEDLKNKTKAEIDQLCTTENQIADITETAVLMSGKYDDNDTDNTIDGSLTLNPGPNALKTIKLKRLVAKSTFTIQANPGITFILQSCELRKYPCSSTLMEREGWEGTNPGTLSYKGNSIKDKIAITNFNEVKGKYSFFFYTQENVQPAKKETNDYNMREKRVDTNYNTFEYAPDDATYVVIKGMYDGPGDNGMVTGNVTYTIHLGDFSEETGSKDNFSIRRNVRYNYTVTVAGVDKIIAEAMAENNDNSEDFQNGAEGDIIKQNENTAITVDAHYETVLLKLSATLGGGGYALSIKTPYTQNIYKNIDEIPDKNSSGDDIYWIKFGKPQSTSQFHSYSDLYRGNYGGLCGIKDLLQELKAGEGDHILKSGDYYYVTAYINEYYYADEEGNLQTGKDISDFVNADDREMTLVESMHTSPDGHSTYTETPIFSIKQKSIKSCFDLSCENPFGIETIEETEAVLGLPKEEKSYYDSYHEWEWDGYNLDYNKERNGYKNTLATDSNILGQMWSNYIDETKNGYIDGEIPEGIMKKNYSIYQFLTRNRDLNGNGQIEADEIRWYIPAHQQCMELWYGDNSLPMEARLNAQNRNYLTSTPGVNRTWWAEEGSAFGWWKNEKLDYWGKNAVRVVRSLIDCYVETTSITDYDEVDRIVTINYLADANIRTTSMTGNYVEHWTGEEADKLPKKFKIAKKYHLKNTTEYTVNDIATDKFIGNTYSEYKDLSDKGKWRVPNEKELGLMLQFVPDLELYTVGRTRYENNRYYYVQNNDGKFITTQEINWEGSSSNWWEQPKPPIPRNVLLVRDVE